MQLTYVTSNPNKAAQLSRYLDYPIKHRALDLSEIQSLDLTEIAIQKAEAAYALLQTPVLVEDTSIIFNALGKLPGPLIKWFLGELGTDGLCALVNDNRTAVATVCYALHDGTHIHTFVGSVTGTIASKPRGDHSFGWNPIFIPDGYTETWGEMDQTTQDATSMRRKALIKIKRFLLTTPV